MLKWKLLHQHRKGDFEIELSTQNNNFTDYKSVLNEIGVIDFPQAAAYRTKRRLYRAFDFFAADWKTKLRTS